MFLNNDQWTNLAQDLHKKKSLEVWKFFLVFFLKNKLISLLFHLEIFRLQVRKNALKRLYNLATIECQNFDARPQLRQGLQDALADKDECLAVSVLNYCIFL